MPNRRTGGLLDTFGPRSLLDALDVDRVLDVGGRLGTGHELTIAAAPWAQLAVRVTVAVALDDTVSAVAAELRRLTVHNIVTHLEPSGWLLTEVGGHEESVAVDVLDALTASCGLELVDRSRGWPGADGQRRSPELTVSLHRRVARTTVHDLVAEARGQLVRLQPDELAALLGGPDDVLVVDTRTPIDRERTGVIEGSLHTPRTVLEWRCDPASGYSLPEISGFGHRLVVVCNDGYSSSLAAAALQRIGHVRATDLVGGIAGWQAAGLPLVAPRASSG